MQNRLVALFIFIFSAVLFVCNKAQAQGYINFSQYTGNAGNGQLIKVINGETYLLDAITTTDFPVTNGSAYRGDTDLVFAKYSIAGHLLYATYLGGSRNDAYSYQFSVVNGEAYIATATRSSDYPVTTGNTFKGGRDIAVTKLGATGNIIFSTLVGGIDEDILSHKDSLIVTGNAIYIGGVTASTDFPHTSPANVYAGGANDAFIIKLNATSGALMQSRLIGGAGSDGFNSLFVENGFAFLTLLSSSQNIPVTLGPSYTIDQYGEPYVIKLETTGFATIYSRFVGPYISRYPYLHAQLVNGEMLLYGNTTSSNYPVTNNTVAIAGYNGFYTRLNTDGTIDYSTYLSTDGNDFIQQCKIVNGNIYLGGVSQSAFSPSSILMYKINESGSFVYSKKIKVSDYGDQFYTISDGFNFEEVDGDLYLSGTTSSAQFPVTNNSQFGPYRSGYFMHLNNAGDIEYSSFLGSMFTLPAMKYANNKFYLVCRTNVQGFPVSDSSTLKGLLDNLLIVLNPDGSNFFATYIGGEGSEYSPSLEISGTDVYLKGYTTSLTYPVTQNMLYNGNSFDLFITKVSFCPDNFLLSNDTLRPVVQTVCKYGFAQKITGQYITVPGDSLPIIYRNAVAERQKPIGTTYQWQRTTSTSGPFADITNATFKDYTPVIGQVSQYYRRLAFRLATCGGILVHTSDTVSVLVNNFTAPALHLGGPYITCPGSSIITGGTPTATGGNPPYALYEWDNGLPAVANPAASPALNTIYTLIVTDNEGCKQIGQALVYVYSANAGADKSSCAGNAVQIGGSPVAGVPGVIYNWQPAAGLSNSNIAQPYANPAVATGYTLNLTVPKTDGSTCVTKDTVSVTPVAAPVTIDFAGTDTVICLGSATRLGTTSEVGYSYFWTPNNYLNSFTVSQPNYISGNSVMPNPNPATLTLTAQKNGCFFTDQVQVATIESNAGKTGCGPRLIGMPDHAPNINETYSWTLVSGPGSFTGATNLPQVPVSASVGGPSVYGLTVSYNGSSCYSEVTVPGLCIVAPVVSIVAKYGCPDYDVNFGNVVIAVSSNVQNPVYTWQPQEGLSNYTGSTVRLTDNVQRTYYVTLTSASDTSFHAVDSIKVNDTAFSRPVFDARDTVTCINMPVTIGATGLPGYTYTWEGTGLSDVNISNPIATVSSQTSFPVTVINNNGCSLQDTVVVNVEHVQRAAGDDWLICSNGMIKLGTAAQPGISYVWEPQVSPWQNGTNQFSAQPEVLVATDITFQVTATTVSGCIARDSADVTINSSPTIADAPGVTICKGGQDTIGLPALPGVSYQWSPAAGLSDPHAAQPLVLAPEEDITYTVQATFPGGCSFPATDNVQVTVSDAAFDMPDINFCPGTGPVYLGTAAPPGMLQYRWQPAGQVTSPLYSNPIAIGLSLSASTTYTLSVINQYGCKASDSITIIPVIASVSAGLDILMCKNASALIGSSSNAVSPNITYTWNPATGLSNSNSGNTLFTAADTGTFTYHLTKTSTTAPSCPSVDSVKIKVSELFLPAFPSPAVCQKSCVQIGIPPVADLQYHWTPSAGLSNANIANPIACIDTVSTTYNLTASSTSGCTASANILIAVNGIRSAQINIPPVTACVGDTGVHFNPSIDPSAPYSFLWLTNDGTLSNTSLPNPTILITVEGIKLYTLQVTDTVTGCSNNFTGRLTVTNCSSAAGIGDYMWFDINGNGIQDNNEPGVSNMSVKLYNSSGYNEATVITSVSGYYSFANITPGNGYYVVFEKPAGYSFTTQNTGGTSAFNNSKVNNTGRSIPFNIVPGTNILNIDAGIKTTGTTPVRLLSFTGSPQNNNAVLLNWQTTAEYNNLYFDVERSNDGINFVAIGRVNGNGTTSLPHSYSLIDAHPFNGNNYYRLGQVDVDGHFVYSNIIVLKISNSPVVTVSYNSLDNGILIAFNAAQNNTQLKLFAANGQLVKAASVKNTNNYLLELPVVTGGVYMLQVMTDKNVYAQKIFIGR